MTISVLIATCDSYSFLWENLSILLDRNIGIEKKYVSCETKEFIEKNYTSVTCDSNIWGTRISKTLDAVSTDYVFFILDDYYFLKKFDTSFFASVHNLLDNTNYNKYCLMDCRSLHNYDLSFYKNNIYIQNSTSAYLTTLQPSIWRVSYLKKVLDKNYSPWDFELKGTEANNHYDNKIFMQSCPANYYFNAGRKGRVISDGWSYIKNLHNLKEFTDV
jgi:hypothetical protein